jgi:small subunit ribosomal protein S20
LIPRHLPRRHRRWGILAAKLKNMPIIKSAKKALRQNLRRQAKNKALKNKLKVVLKDARTLVSQKKAAEVQKNLPAIFKAIDKAAKKGLLKKNAAARRKSSIARLLAKASA